ncbi:MAG: FAD-dependent oxidoreductase [Chloroflexi bacterium]|nr:FAD-dependent oxidoreductase [Chloroflexota bacterium]MBU1749350.1 FAD-dependent oxidoreductase [Chloroflexota bacterium]
MTDNLYPYPMLFSPIQVNGVKLKNRIVMGPMGNINMAEETGRPNDKMIQYFAERAKGGVGLITSGLVPTSHGIDPSVTDVAGLSYFPRIDRSRTVLSGWRDLAESVHAYGARFFIQLTPGLGRVGSPECLLKKWKLPVSASWNPNFYMPAVPCRPLWGRECRRIIRATGQAAADAKACLIDGVYLHGHEGYLLEQMSNTAFNRRRWGRFANWQTFGIELVQEIRDRCGPAYPIMYRIDLSLALRETYGARMNQVRSLRPFRRERSVAQTLDYMHNLVRAGVDMFDVDLGCYDNWWLPHPPAPMPPGCFLLAAQLVKTDFAEHEVQSNAGLPVPIVAVGKLGYPDLAERALQDSQCDMVMLARPLLADPYWPQKAFAGQVREIIPCIGDQEACINEFIHGGHPQCAVNPRTGFEDVLPDALAPAPRPKRVAVVGAGPAGVMCACTAAQRGHDVTLFEQRDAVGGTLIPGSVPRFKFDVANYVAYLDEAVWACAREHKLALRLDTRATVDLLQQEGFDAVVLCIGARPSAPPVPGIDGPHVVQAVDLLRDPARADRAKHVVVVGGGDVGCEMAYFLVGERDKAVTVIEMLPYFMADSCSANRGYLIHYLEQAGVMLLNCTRLQSIQENTVTVVRNVSPTVPDPYVTWAPVLPENVKNPLARPIKVQEQEQTLSADLVVLAAGARPDDALYEACVQARVAPEIHNIGDSFAPGRVFEATKAGYAVGRLL